MPYLIHCDGYECVNISVIIGVSIDKDGLFELLLDFSTLKIKNLVNLDNDNDNTSVFSITEDDYNYFQEYYKQIQHKIESNRKKYYGYDYNLIQEKKEYFWHLVIDIDGKKDKLFDKEFITKYKSITEQQPILYYYPN